MWPENKYTTKINEFIVDFWFKSRHQYTDYAPGASHLFQSTPLEWLKCIAPSKIVLSDCSQWAELIDDSDTPTKMPLTRTPPDHLTWPLITEVNPWPLTLTPLSNSSIYIQFSTRIMAFLKHICGYIAMATELVFVLNRTVSSH